MASTLDKLTDLIKALEAGLAIGPPGSLTQGAALQRQDLSPVMNLVTFGEKQIKLQKALPVDKARSTLVEFNRQLSYGIPGGSATLEVSAGQDDTGDYVRAVVPMAFYVNRRTVSFAADQVEAFDGQKASEREAKNAAMKIAWDIEKDLMLGKSDFSNAGVFDGNPLSIPQLMPGMPGLDVQIRQSDNILNTQDLVFSEYGSSDTIIISVGGTLTQSNIEDLALRSVNNMGQADALHLSTDALAQYNKIAFGKERIVLAGSPQGATGATLGVQWTSQGPINLEPTHFLRGKTRAPSTLRGLAPLGPTVGGALVSGSTSFTTGQVYNYVVTGVNEAGEGNASSIVSVTITSPGQSINLTITAAAGNVSRWYNVYRSAPTLTALSVTTSLKFVGRVARSDGTNTVFSDLGNRSPGASVGILLDKRGVEMVELAPFTGVDLALVDTARRQLFYRFVTLKVAMPRFSALAENIF